MHRPRPNAALKTRSQGAKNHAANSRDATRSVLKTVRRVRKTPAKRSAARKWTRHVSKSSRVEDSRIHAMPDEGLPILRVRKIAAAGIILQPKAFIVRQ
jgi:hypothetical protein